MSKFLGIKVSKGRKLSSDELVLWNHVKKTISGTKKPSIDNDEENKFLLPRKNVFQPLKKKSLDFKSKSVSRQNNKNQQNGMDQNTLKKLKRGKLSPEATLDLHGFTTKQASSALTSFITKNYKLKNRLVLIITGKGERNYKSEEIFSNKGVLRKIVPQWLRSPPINDFVLETVESHIKDGGSGALYVYLKRNKQV